MRIAVPCKSVGISGGLLRFERVGAELGRRGHEVSYVALSGDTRAQRPTAFPILTLEQAESRDWDVVMLPGAGFPEAMMESIERFTHPRFGIRLQHILNDRTRAARFLALNCVFRPHRVIFNNRDWAPGTFTDFQAATFHILEGAVDRGTPKSLGSPKLGIVGGLANKNPAPLIEAARALGLAVRLFGDGRELPSPLPSHVEWVGPLFGSDLENFYASVDVIVHTERMAGWANLVAEAMAFGIPVICTRAGTQALATHEETALILEEPSPEQIGSALRRLMADPMLGRRMAGQAWEKVGQFSWASYADNLLSLCSAPAREDYLWAPQWKLYGKWPLATRSQGLEPVLANAAGSSVLDLGCAEGFLSRLCLDAGAALAHGVDVSRTRIAEARELCAESPESRFWVANLDEWDQVVAGSGGVLRETYDIVLYLGVHHHISEHRRMDVLQRAAALAKHQFAVRMPEGVFERDRVADALAMIGLREAHWAPPGPGAGPMRVYERLNCAN